MAQAMMFREVWQAFPNEDWVGTNMYGTFLSSHNKGKCMTISIGSVSAAIMMTLAIPLFKAFVASLAPFFNYPFFAASAMSP